MSDRDVRVHRDYLEQLVGPLLEPDVGIVTCSYRGMSHGGLWSLLGRVRWREETYRVARDGTVLLS